jgi:hypothetical protein
MLRTWILSGMLLLLLSLSAFSLYVIPRAFAVPDVTSSDTVRAEPVQAPGSETRPSNAMAVVVAITAGLGLAAGAMLIGIGIGHWRHPRPLAGRWPADDIDPTRSDAGT